MKETVIKAYAPDRRLCLATILMEYMERVRELRGDYTGFFLTTVKPYRLACKATISRWIKETLCHAGIDMDIFTVHSTRSAATSAAKAARVPINTITSTAGWSNSCTFAKYYDKPVIRQGTFAHAILSQSKRSELENDSDL